MKKNNKDDKKIGNIINDVIKDIEKASKTKGTVTGITSGFRELDYKTQGFQNGELTVIAARPSMGKTAFVLNMLQHMTFQRDYKALIFSLEMSKELMTKRLLSLESAVEVAKIRTGDLKDDHWGRIIDAVVVIEKSELIIDDTTFGQIEEVKNRFHKYKEEGEIDIIFIDSLQLMSDNGQSNSRLQEMSEVSRMLKSLARELDIPIVVLSQLGREVERRPDKRPMLIDLGDAGGAIGEYADVVIFIYRDYYYNMNEDDGIAEIVVAKNRNGSIGMIKLAWISPYLKFRNMAPKHIG
jgi:Replicative DNA helicase